MAWACLYTLVVLIHNSEHSALIVHVCAGLQRCLLICRRSNTTHGTQFFIGLMRMGGTRI